MASHVNNVNNVINESNGILNAYPSNLIVVDKVLDASFSSYLNSRNKSSPVVLRVVSIMQHKVVKDNKMLHKDSVVVVAIRVKATEVEEASKNSGKVNSDKAMYRILVSEARMQVVR